MSLLDTPICCRSCYFLKIHEAETFTADCARKIRLPIVKQSCKAYEYNVAKSDQFDIAVAKNHARYMFNELHPLLYKLRKFPIINNVYRKRLTEYLTRTSSV